MIDRSCFGCDGLPVSAFSAAIRDPLSLVVAAERDGQLVGYIFVLRQSGQTDRIELGPNERFVWQIASIAVVPECSGQGLAMQMIDATEMLAYRTDPEAAAARWVAEVSPNNAQSLRLFRAAGYEPLQTLPDYYGPSRPAIRLEKLPQRTAYAPGAPEPQPFG